MAWSSGSNSGSRCDYAVCFNDTKTPSFTGEVIETERAEGDGTENDAKQKEHRHKMKSSIVI